MPVSQFKIYTSSDPQGPGAINGLSGSLTSILDACLVDGYGTGSFYKAPAGWSKPLQNISSSVGQKPQLACYKQGSGSLFTLFVNDAYPNVTAAGREAWLCGYEYITSLTSSNWLGSGLYTASYGNGTGNGQFPLPSQLLTYGHIVVRKSINADAVVRPWLIAADASTVYMWISTGDNAGYYHWGFGDIFSFNKYDTGRCFIYGRISENSSTVQSVDWTAEISQGSSATAGGYYSASTLFSAQPGHYTARPMGGIGVSSGFTKRGDVHQNSAALVTPYSTFLVGVYATPNIDGTFFIHPIYVIDPGCAGMRGRLRGLYQVCHPLTNFGDGQIITGAGDYAGKTLMIVRPANDLIGFWALEISNTVETN